MIFSQQMSPSRISSSSVTSIAPLLRLFPLSCAYTYGRTRKRPRTTGTPRTVRKMPRRPPCGRACRWWLRKHTGHTQASTRILGRRTKSAQEPPKTEEQETNHNAATHSARPTSARLSAWPCPRPACGARRTARASASRNHEGRHACRACAVRVGSGRVDGGGRDDGGR